MESWDRLELLLHRMLKNVVIMQQCHHMDLLIQCFVLWMKAVNMFVSP